MMLRCSRKYDLKTDSIVYANNQPYTRQNYQSAGVGPEIEPTFRFCRHMCQLKVDNAEYALLTAIVIFSGMYLKTRNFFVLKSNTNCLLLFVFTCREATVNWTEKSGKDSRILYRHSKKLHWKSQASSEVLFRQIVGNFNRTSDSW